MDPYVALMLAKFCRAVTSVRAMLAPVCPVWPKRPAYTASPAVNQSQLDAELADFVASLLAGVIYLSMGSSLRMVRVPAAALCQLFAAVLARLPRHHVLRTWAGIEEYSIDDLELLSALPATVRVRDWLLQKDILGHNQILKLFIIHGGLLRQHDLVQHGGNVRQLELAHLDEEAPYRPYTLFCIMIAVGFLLQVMLVDQLVSDISLVAYWNENVIKHFGALASSWQTYEFGLICYNYRYAVKTFSF